MTIEEKKARVADLRPIDDVFFEVLASEKLVCQEMLRTIMEDPGLEVLDVMQDHISCRQGYKRNRDCS